MKSLIAFLFSMPLLLMSQDLPSQYYFSNDSQQLLRGDFEVDNGLYSESDVDTVFLYFDQSDYWEQMTDNYCDKVNLSATMIYKNEEFLEVGVRFKGQTSYANTNGDTGGGGPGGGGGVNM